MPSPRRSNKHSNEYCVIYLTYFTLSAVSDGTSLPAARVLYASVVLNKPSIMAATLSTVFDTIERDLHDKTCGFALPRPPFYGLKLMPNHL